MTKPEYLKTEIFLDSGNPDETREALELLGFLDGQTTNPSLVTKNPHIQELKSEGLLDMDTTWENYREVAQKIREIIPEGSISVEVYADKSTTEEAMLKQARELAQWFSGIFIKLPATKVGLSVAHILAGEGVNINITLCFSQEQAAAVHMATEGAMRGKVYVSPFIGRLDDIGQNGLDLISNIQKMYKEWGSHVLVLAASIRGTDHIFACLQKEVDIITVPLMILKAWKESDISKDPSGFAIPDKGLAPIPYEELSQKQFSEYDIYHALTDKGIEKFVADWKSLLPAIDQ